MKTKLADNKLVEPLAVLSVIAIMIGVPLVVSHYKHAVERAGHPAGAKIFVLTGLQGDGIWTTETVAGYNYWWKTFQPAAIKVEVGDYVVFRFESGDVHHRFYLPALNIGPVEIEPGIVKQVAWKATEPGTFQYYCTSICGDCHFYMQGWVIVSSPGQPPPTPPPRTCKHEFDEPADGDVTGRGRFLFQKLGCATCHGEEGKGGIENYNYAKKTVPALNTLAEKLYLESEEDTAKIVELLQQGKDIEKLDEPLDIPRARLVLAQYRSVRELVPKGSLPSKLDPHGPQPPLEMPSWEGRLGSRDIDSIVAYLLTLYRWENGEEWEEDEEWEDSDE